MLCCSFSCFDNIVICINESEARISPNKPFTVIPVEFNRRSSIKIERNTNNCRINEMVWWIHERDKKMLSSRNYDFEVQLEWRQQSVCDVNKMRTILDIFV